MASSSTATASITSITGSSRNVNAASRGGQKVDVAEVVGLDDRVAAPGADLDHELVEREAGRRLPLAEYVQYPRLGRLVLCGARSWTFLPQFSESVLADPRALRLRGCS